MFVRWKKRKCIRKYRSRESNFYLDAVLVETYRDNGKVKQRFIKYLGTVADNSMILQKHDFWNEVTKRLNSMDLDESERAKIEQSILKRIPMPTDDEIKAVVLKLKIPFEPTLYR